MTSASSQFVEYAKTLGCTEDRAIRAKAITLDDLIELRGVPHFVKIDVEGMDADVLKGLARRRSFYLSNITPPCPSGKIHANRFNK